uniref:Peptidase S1 domain-containing protein n=1 Tax=Amphora coffeiformis TaxID=265554 RepID=A0A7S3L5L1_9STRA|mmetsp:Transcript_15148/g.30801  ORF Transcript_15148/g.30801 Transcript_15148/m.30801 type:complete len:387 (-) Transcript_15148:25-1185(-)|eukprot:scaffold370_cov176-Amphora_coffeaeformis.AAC.12
MLPAAAKSNNRRRLIVNGQDAPANRFPYFSTLDRYCAGALIAPDIVLTAGHCKPHRRRDIGQLHVGTYYFDYDLDAEDNGEANYDDETFDLSAMVRHPEFKRKGDDEFRHDFTILKLSGVSSQRIVRINRDPRVPFPDQGLVSMGLGFLYDVWEQDDDEDDDTERPLRPELLQEANVNYLPSDICRLASDEDESYSHPQNRIGETHLCTYVPPTNGRDACAYDSGGPIIIPSKDGNSDGDLLVALVSWGIGCADPIFPAVNARVSAVSDWIDAQVCSLSDFPPEDFYCNGRPTPPPIPLPISKSMGGVIVTATLIAFGLAVLLARGLRKRQLLFREKTMQTLFEESPTPPNESHSFVIKRMTTDETVSLRSSFGSEEDFPYGSISP